MLTEGSGSAEINCPHWKSTGTLLCSYGGGNSSTSRLENLVCGWDSVMGESVSQKRVLETGGATNKLWPETVLDAC